MTQIEGGNVPFNVPKAASKVAVFDNMPQALLWCGPLVKAGCYIILDTPQAQPMGNNINIGYFLIHHTHNYFKRNPL